MSKAAKPVQMLARSLYGQSFPFPVLAKEVA
jgi:hypothetical protein